jgi:glycoside/pentoside/hexuronide:cation symporter, GPH family
VNGMTSSSDIAKDALLPVDAAPSDASARSSAARIRFWQLIAYALPAASTSLMIVPLTAVLPSLYNKYYGVPFEAIGLALLITRLGDAFLDPLTAYLSDKTKTRLGARKPWMVAGALVSAIGVYFLFLPDGVPSWNYFLIWSGVVYIGWTLIAIPHSAWGAEMSGDYDERSKIVTVSGMVGAVGGTLFFAAPIILPFETENITPEVMRIVGIATIVFVPLSVLIATLFAPTGKSVTTFDVGVLGTIRGLWQNKPFRIFVTIFILQGVALGINATLLYAFTDGYLHIGERFARITILASVATFVAIPVWLWACNRYGKHLAWAVGSLTTNLVLVAYLFITPGEDAYIPTLVVNLLFGLLGSCAAVCYPAILADVIDYGTLKTGSNRAGSYFAVTMLFVKGTAAVGGGLATMLVGLFGFSMAEGAVNDDLANFGMLFVFIGLHTLLQMVAIPLIWYFPIDKRRQAIIRKRIEQRAVRAARNGAVPS